MTVKDVVKDEISRLVLTLPGLDPVKDITLYDKVLECLSTLAYLPLGEEWREERHELEATEQTPEHPIDNVTPFPEPSTEEYIAPVMETPDPEPEPEPAKTYSMPEVRAALAQSRKKGVNVTEILKEFGTDNFTGLPASKYPELMARLESL